MKRSLLTIYVATLLFFTAIGQKGGTVTIAGQDTNAVKGETYALIVGVSSYQHLNNQLHYAHKDAELFRDFLLSKAGGEAKPQNITLLTNDSATAGNFNARFFKLYNNPNLKKGDRVYIYFSGHGDGIPKANEYYLLLNDCPNGDANNYLAGGTIFIVQLKNRVNALTRMGVEVVLVLDACRTNTLPGGDAANGFYQNVAEQKRGEIMMFACGPGEESIENSLIGGGHGLFTYELIEGLSGSADLAPNGNEDHAVSQAELQDWVRGRVRNIASKDFKVKQVPFFCCSETEGMEIAKVDSAFSSQFQIAGNNNLAYANYFAVVNKKSITTEQLPEDEGLEALFKNFNTALQNNRLWGAGSANAYYDSLFSKYPNAVTTNDARYTLAGELLNFSQQKINLYLTGKDNDNALGLMVKESAKPGIPQFLRTKLYRDTAIARTDFFTTALMLKKAGLLLATQDSSFLQQSAPRLNFLLARSHYEDGAANNITFTDALQLARNALQADNKAAYITHVMALLFQKNRQYDSALYFERKAIALAPKWAYAYNHLGYIFYKQGNTDSAWYYYQKALGADSSYLEPYINLSIIANEKGRDGQYGKYHHKYFKLPGVEPAMLTSWGNQLFLMGKYEAAIWFFNQVLNARPGNADAYFNIANSYSKQPGQAALAKLNYEKAIAANPLLADAYVNLGAVYGSGDNKNKAKEYFEKALHIDAYNAIASYNIGNLFLNAGQYDSALYYYYKTIAIDSSYPDAYLNMGYAYKALNKTDSALHFYTKAINADKYYIAAYNNIGAVYQGLNNTDSALYYFTKAINLQPGYDKVLHKRFPESLQQEISLLPKENLASLNNLGVLYEGLNRCDSAIKYYQLALAKAPTNTDYYYAIGTCSSVLGQYDSALYYLKKSIVNTKADTAAYYNIACVYSLQKDSANALSYLEKAFKAGFADKVQLMNDADLDFIRSSALFKELMGRYFKK